MGEAKRKTHAKAALQSILDSLKMHSLGRDDVDAHAQGLVVEVGHIQAARSTIGVLPPLVEDAIDQAHKMRDSDGQSPVFAVVWAHWPSGRQEVHMVQQTEDLKDQVFTKLVMDAGVRGYGVKFCAFPGAGWNEEFTENYDQAQKHMAEVRRMVASQSEPRVVRLGGEIILCIPFLENIEMRAGMAALLLRKLDELVATEESLRHSFGSVVLSFDGLDSDPREVWEFEHCAELLRRLNKHAPYWPVLVKSEQFLIFLGALLANGNTIVNTMKEVSFPIDAGVANVLQELWLQSSMEAVHAAGMSVNSEAALGRFFTIRQVVDHLTQMLSERTKALASGEQKVASQEEILQYQQDRPRTRHAIVLDRSARGQELTKQMLHGVEPLPSESARATLENWFVSKEPMAVVSFASHEMESSWQVSSHADDSQALHNMVRGQAIQAINDKASFAWTLGVEEALMRQLAELGKTLFPQVAAELGYQAFEPEKNDTAGTNQWHEGLLKLATEPIGREVDFDMIQITDTTEFAKVSTLGMDALMSAMEDINQGKRQLENPEDLEKLAEGQLRAWEREDGTLLVRETSKTPKEVVIEAGKWRLLSQSELAAVQKQVKEKWATDPDFPADLSKLAETLNRTLDSRAKNLEAMNRVSETVTSIVGVFGRESQSLLAMKSVLGDNASAIDAADRWLNGSDAYFVFWRAKTGEASAFCAHDESMLVDDVLPSALDLGEGPDKTFLFTATSTAVDHRAEQWWSAQGGVTRPVIRQGH